MILCCGEALIDMLPRTTTDGVDAFAPFPGGSVFNTAIALGRLGEASGFFSGLSSDLFGDMLRDSLTASNVDHGPAHVSDRPTTLAFVRLIDGQATYAFYDENTAGRMLTEADLPDTPADALFFGGISLVAEPCGSAYDALQARAAPDAVTMIDPNIRTSFVTDAGAYRARIERMIARADIVKISDEDLHWIEGEGDPASLARDILSRGPSLVLVTEGARGATGYTATLAERVGARRVDVVDTVGAGDTFNAGVLASLSRAGALTKSALRELSAGTVRDAIDLGARAAAVTVSRAGANPPWRHDL